MSDWPGYLVRGVAGFALAAWAGGLMRLVATVFDHDLPAIVVGIGAASVVLGAFLRLRQRRDWSAAACLWLAAVAVAILVAMLGVLALDSVPALLGAAMLAAVPYVLIGWIVGGRRQEAMAALFGAAAGILAAPLLIESASGPLSLGWYVAIILAALAPFAGDRRTLPVVGGLGVLAAAVFFLAHGRQENMPGPGDAALLERPLVAATRTGRLAGAPVVRWGRGDRADVLAYEKQAEMRWVFTDTAAPAAVVKRSGADLPLGWYRDRFPLFLLPLEAAGAGRVLTVGAVAGVERELATLAGAKEVLSLAYNDAVTLADLGADACGSGVKCSDDIRGLLQASGETFGLVLLPVNQISSQRWMASNVSDRPLYTAGAFRDYWGKLAEGGVLAVTTHDEALFVRLLLQVWDMLLEKYDDDPRFARTHVWGYRLLPGAPFRGPYRFLLVVAKGESGALGKRLGALVGDMPVAPLFGPGLRPRRPYGVLYHRGTTESLREVFTGVFSRQAGRWLDLSEVTDQRPFPFSLFREKGRVFKWVVAAGLVPLIYVLLFPLGAMRRPASSWNQVRPGVALVAIHFSILAAVCMFVATGLYEYLAALAGMSFVFQAAVLAAFLGGAGLGLAATGRAANARPAALVAGWPTGMLLVLAAIGAVGALFPSLYALPWAFRASLAMALAASWGLVAAGFLRAGLSQLGDLSEELAQWQLAAVAAVFFVAPALAMWIAEAGGWAAVWGLSVIAPFLLGALGWWLWRPV